MATEDNNAEVKAQLENIKTALTRSRNNYETDLNAVKQGLGTIYNGSPIVENAVMKINNILSDGTVDDSYNYAFSVVNSRLEE